MYEELSDSRAEAVQRMRQISLENGYRLGRRGGVGQDTAEETPENILRRIMAKTRLLLTIFLVGAVIFLDRSGLKIGSLNSQKIFQAMELDYEHVFTDKISQLIFSVWQAPQ